MVLLMKSSLSWMLCVNIENHKKFIAHNVLRLGEVAEPDA